MSTALIILGDQLFPVSFYQGLKTHPVFMAEDFGLCTHFKYHKHKITFFLTAMRTYAEELRTKGFNVYYEELSETSYLKRLEKFISNKKIKKIVIGEIQDKFFEKELKDFFIKKQIELEVLETPMFLCSRDEFQKYLKRHKRPFMKSFYEEERKRLKILLERDGKPVGGKWSFDTENRKKAPKTLDNKEPPSYPVNTHLKKVIELVDKSFQDHPGDNTHFWLPVDRKSSLKNLRHFLQHHIYKFGDYQDAITPRSPFLYHSLISLPLNSGLLTPQEVIDEVLEVWRNDSDIPLSSIEGFIRQVIGWREFVRGIYQNFSEKEEKENFFNHQRKLTSHWYQGTTGIPPVDDAIKKAGKFGYCHHIERLMILSNIMLLSEVHPLEVHKWFMEMFIDSADWVMGPNVFGMGQFSDGGIFATKPYISGSNYILKMSDYKKGEWSEIWDGLYWRFIDKHSEFFSRNHRLNMMVKSLQKMNPEKKKKLFKIAENFIISTTA